jgi:hypothetical protein
LATHGEVPAQTAAICPGSGLKVYSSDHWRPSTDAIEDAGPNNNAISDNQTEADATTGWSISGGTLTSEVDEVDGIDSNGTTYVFKAVSDNGAFTIDLSSPVTTVIGQRYRVSIDSNATGTIKDAAWKIGTTDEGSDLGQGTLGLALDEWQNWNAEFIATTTSTYFTITAGLAAGLTALYLDDFYFTKVGGRDILGDWLALTDCANAQVDLYNDNDDSFSAGSLDFGTVSSYTGGTGNIDFPTTSTMTDSAKGFLFGGAKPGDVWKIWFPLRGKPLQLAGHHLPPKHPKQEPLL